MKDLRLFPLIALLLVLVLASCTKDRVPFEVDPGTPSDTTDTIGPGLLKINEFVARGSQNQNEFGNTADWFEIFNTSTNAVTLEAGQWFVTDDGSSDPEKYELPLVTIPGRGFLVIWCDSEDRVVNDIHTSFNLSSGGEDIAIYYKDSTDALIEIDAHTYGQQTQDAVSSGRFPDGADNWITFNTPTPGSSNQ